MSNVRENVRECTRMCMLLIANPIVDILHHQEIIKETMFSERNGI